MAKRTGDTRAAVIIIIAVLILAWYFWYSSQNKSSVPYEAEVAMFVCEDGRSVTALYNPADDSRVRLRFSHSPEVSLSQAISASGARYASADEKFTFWSEDGEAAVTENGKITYADCQALAFKEQ